MKYNIPECFQAEICVSMVADCIRVEIFSHLKMVVIYVYVVMAMLVVQRLLVPPQVRNTLRSAKWVKKKSEVIA